MIIGITTFFQSQTNYGQLLQAFALQQILMQQGHYPYIIRYGFHYPLQLALGWKNPDINFEKLLKNCVCSAEPGSRNNRRFDDFRKAHLNLSENAYNSLEELRVVPPIADCYITGSDQVWAQLLSYEGNATFFLDFGPKWVRRLSYAPSFAMKTYPKNLQERLAHHLRCFDAVSIREKTGLEVCAQIGVSAQWVVDPTMLLDGDYYRSLGRESQSVLPSGYMLVYHVNVQEKDMICWSAFKEYNHKYGLSGVAVHANGENLSDVEFLDEVEYVYPSVQDWIRLIDGSEYVLTTSFHGMVFSILLHKPFVVILRPKSQYAGNDRISNLLEELGLLNRIYQEGSDIEHLLQNPIDWEQIDEKVQRLRNSSLYFLKKALNSGASSHKKPSDQTWNHYFEQQLSFYFLSVYSERQKKELQIERFRAENAALECKRTKYVRLFRVALVLCVLLFIVLISLVIFLN